MVPLYCGCSPVGAHVLDFEHRLGVLLHEVHLVRVPPVNILHPVTQVVLPRVKVLRVRVRRDVRRWVAVRVRRENLREGVSHLELPVERSVKVSLHWVKTAVLAGTLRSWAQRVVRVLIGQPALEKFGVFRVGRELALFVLGHLDEGLGLTEGLVLLCEALCGHATSVGVD